MPEHNVLLVQSSARRDGSVTRELAETLAHRLGDHVTTRDLADGVSLLDESWVAANAAEPETRTAAQQRALAGSDALVSEIMDAQTLVIAAPIYNFSIPAALKAWIDQIARARLTFRYSENGPVGLLAGRKAYLVVSSGGVPAGSAADFATPYLHHVLRFVGIEDVEVIDASAQLVRGEEALHAARMQVDAMTAQKAA